MKPLIFLASLNLVLGFAYSATAQTQPASPPANAVAIDNGAQFLMRDGAVVLHQGTSYQPLSKNIQLHNGTKINYKSGIIELPGGKLTTLHEGDYVTSQGEIVFATPASAAAARGARPTTSNAQFKPYVQVGTSSADVQSKKLELMSKEIELLKQKVDLLSGTGPHPSTSQLDQQLRTLEVQLSQLK